MKIIKRSGAEVAFDPQKIVIAVTKANDSVVPSARMSAVQIKRIAEDVESAAQNINRSLSVEEIQDMVEDQIMNQRAFDVARRYITYRYRRALVRKSNTTDEQILSLIECNNEEVKQENSNKNPTVNSVQRDYMAGEVSKDITKRLLLPPDIVNAHEQGLIHFHDADYFAQHMHNCDLVNLEDMLQNGTVISGTLIEKPHSFSTACNIATQIIAQVASCQYGGQSISLTHLAPFVDVSRQKIRRQVADELHTIREAVTEEDISAITEKRLVPDYISEKIMLQNKIDKNGEGHCYTCMGCRSFLTPYVDENGQPKYYGRFNQGVVTVNLVDIGLSADGDMKKFWEIFDERMELCHRALQCRHERLTGTLSDAAPILWQYGALLRLKKGEKIDKYLHGGYSTLSLGYAGLWECVYSLNGKKLTEPEGEALGLEIMKKLNEYTAKWKAAENIDYSLYGTPLESTTFKFAKCLQKRFGIVKDVTDRNYITNSYHVHVTENIDAFDKLALEAKFQALSPGGAISYVEVPNMQNNLEAVLSVMKFIYDHIMYAELNTKSDYCQVCGYDGEIEIKEDEHGKLIWQCPNCGNTDQNKMNVARRTCGYIGTQFWNQGRTQEIKERVLHL